MRRLALLALAAVALAGCADSSVGPTTPALGRMGNPGAGGAGVTVMTRNLYEGANLDPILLATDPNQIPILAGQIWGRVIATDFAARAGALAREIARANPDLVGLQEVALWRVQMGPNPFLPATTVRYDFLRLLLDSLQAQGADYDSVAAQIGADVQLPAVVSAAPLTIIGVRLTNREAIIARHGVPVWNATGGVYAAAVQIHIGTQTIPELRTWVSTRALVAGHEIRFVTTHLEQQRAQSIQVAQAQELIAMLANEPQRLVLVGDFNSAGDGSQTPTYGMLLQAGYADAWADQFPSTPGYTCCMADDLLNAVPQLDQRLDLILVRNPFSHAAEGIPGRVNITLVGSDPSNRTASGLWPSDHDGVVANLLLPPVGLPRGD